MYLLAQMGLHFTFGCTPPALDLLTAAGSKAAEATREYYMSTRLNITEVGPARQGSACGSPVCPAAGMLHAQCHASMHQPAMADAQVPSLLAPQFADVDSGMEQTIVEMSLWDAGQRAINAFRSVAGECRQAAPLGWQAGGRCSLLYGCACGVCMHVRGAKVIPLD